MLRRSDFEPALGFAHGLVINLLKAERVDIEVEGFVLVADAYSDGADFREHSFLLSVDHQSLFVVYQPGLRKTSLILRICRK